MLEEKGRNVVSRKSRGICMHAEGCETSSVIVTAREA